MAPQDNAIVEPQYHHLLYVDITLDLAAIAAGNELEIGQRSAVSISVVLM